MIDIRNPPRYLDEPAVDYAGRLRRFIVFDTFETEQIAVSCTRSIGQRAEIEDGFWRVDEDNSKLRQRIEAKGLHFEPLGRPYINSSTVYLISNPRKHIS